MGRREQSGAQKPQDRGITAGLAGSKRDSGWVKLSHFAGRGSVTTDPNRVAATAAAGMKGAMIATTCTWADTVGDDVRGLGLVGSWF